jgi:threonine efflux protein
MTEELLAFAIIMVIGQFSPGPDMLLLTRTALAGGLKAGALMVFGIVSGLAIHATIAIVGMAVLLEQGGWVSAAVRGLASIYLGWLAFGLLRSTQSEEQGPDEVRKSPFLRGFLCNLLNPKVFIFFAGVVAPFLRGEHPTWWPYVMWGLIVTEGLVFWLLWVWLLQASYIRCLYRRLSRFLDLLFGGALLVLAVKLVIPE